MTAVGELITPTGILVMDAETMRDDHEGWLAARRWRSPVDDPALAPDRAVERIPAGIIHAHGYRIGSSDVPSILDLDGVDTPVHVYHEKRGNYTKPVNDAMVFGKRFEPAIAEDWCERNRAVIDEIGLVSRVGAPWHQSTIDRRVRECPVFKKRGEGTCGLEVKNVGFASASRWHKGIPDRIYAQILHQLYVTGYEHIHYHCCIGGNTPMQGIVYADREVDVIKYIVAEVDRFRTEHLIPGIEPAWDTSVKAAKLLELDRATHPDRIGKISIDGLDDVLAYVEAQQAEARHKKAKERHAARLAQLAAGKEIVTVAGNRAYWYGETRTTRVNLERLAEKYPDAYDDPEVVYEKVSHPIYIDSQIKKMA